MYKIKISDNAKEDLARLKKTIKIYSEKLRNFYSNYQNILAQELDKLNA